MPGGRLTPQPKYIQRSEIVSVRRRLCRELNRSMAHVAFCCGGLLIDLYWVDHPVSLRKSRRILRHICIASASHGSTSTVGPDFARPLVGSLTLVYLILLRTELIETRGLTSPQNVVSKTILWLTKCESISQPLPEKLATGVPQPAGFGEPAVMSAGISRRGKK